MMRIRIIRNGKNLIIGITATLVLLVFLTVFIAGGIQRTRVQAAVEAGSVAGKDYSNSIPIYSVNNDMKQIALTINCAWEADDIPEILDILDVYNIKAAFFVLGVWAEKNPEELKMISERGHEIGNHSYSHKLPSRITQSQMEEEIDKCNIAIKNITGSEPSLYRAPSGDYNERLLALVHANKMIPVQWSVDSIDWDDNMSKEEIVNRVTGKIHSGAIILFHNDTNHTVEALPEIIEHLQAEQYDFVKVSELVYDDNYMVDNTGRQYKKQN